MHSKILLAIVVSLFACTGVSAQFSFRTEYFGKSSYWLGKDDEPRERIGNTKGSAVVHQGSLNIPLSMKVNEKGQPIVWSIGMSGSYASLNNKNFTDDLVIPKILNLDLGIQHMRPINDRWSLVVGIGGGLYTSSTQFSRIRWKQVLGSMSALFIYQLRPNLQLGGGLAINSTFGYPMAFPALYLNWTLQGKFDFNLSMANGLNVSAGLNVNKFLTVSLIAEMNGQSALLERDGKDVIFTHQYIVAGLQPEIKLSNKISINITAGINAVRPAYYTDRTLKAIFKSGDDYYFQVSPYASAGITIHF